MKKLVFIAAIVAAGLAQAASLDWSISAKAFLMSDGSTKPDAATVYLFDTGATGYNTFITALTGGTLGDSISGETFTGAAGYLGSGTTYTSTKAAQMNLNYAKASGTLTTGTVGNYTLAAIVLDGDKFLVSSGAMGASYTENPDDGSAVQFTAANMTASGWKTYTPSSSDVPEPTSGLLLVLGGAMLALRRRKM